MKAFNIENGVLIRYSGNKKSVTLPEEITVIGNRAFENCKNLQRITIPENVTSMGNFVFIGIHTSPNRKQMCIGRDEIGKTNVKDLIAALNSLGTSEGILIPGEKRKRGRTLCPGAGMSF